MSASLLENVAEPTPDPVTSNAEGSAPRRLPRSARDMLPRAYDALVLVWITVFHHVLGVKYRFAQIAYDEHFFLHEGWSVLKGQVPYKDFQEFKPPVIFYANALGLQLFGMEGLGYRKFLALLSLVSFLALAVALLSRRVHRLLVVAALMLMVNHFYDDALHNEVINDAETLALDFFMLGTGVLLTKTRWERTRWVLGGALLALSPLSKEPMAFAVVAAWLSLLLLARSESRDNATPLRFALYSVAGVAGVMATWLGYMLITQSLSWYILQLKLNFAYTENYAYQLRWASRTPKGGALAEAYRRLTRGYVNAAHLAVFAPFFAALATLPGRRRWVALGAVVTFVASLYAVSIGHGYAPRYFIMAMTGTFFGVALGAIALQDFVAQSSAALGRRFTSHGVVRPSWLMHGVGAAYLLAALLSTLPRFALERQKYASYSAPLPDVPQSEIDFVRSHTGPDDTIFTTNDPLLYMLSDRRSAFRGGIVLDEIIGYYPGDTDEERLAPIRQGLEEKRPKLVVLGNVTVSYRRKRRYMKALVMPFLTDGKYIRLSDKFYLRPD